MRPSINIAQALRGKLAALKLRGDMGRRKYSKGSIFYLKHKTSISAVYKMLKNFALSVCGHMASVSVVKEEGWLDPLKRDHLKASVLQHRAVGCASVSCQG